LSYRASTILAMPTDSANARIIFYDTLVSEMPAFLYWLLNEHEIAEAEVDRRFLVKTWHHPVLRRALEELSTEVQLLALADDILWNVPAHEFWEDTAEQFRRRLLDDRRTAPEARKLLAWKNATGTMLGRLATRMPHRVKIHRSAISRSPSFGQTRRSEQKGSTREFQLRIGIATDCR
jgi:hypothetical protein